MGMKEIFPEKIAPLLLGLCPYFYFIRQHGIVGRGRFLERLEYQLGKNSLDFARAIELETL